MFSRFSLTFVAIIGGLLVLAACGDQTPVELSADELSPSFSGHGERVVVNKGLAAARAATARYRDVEAAIDAGYETDGECVSNPGGPGAMGVHYVNGALVDDEVSVDEPEVLVYAPWRDGEMRLVAVEWIVPLPAASEAPELMGHHFHANPVVGIWGLHAWIWQNNPDGIFADFNPRITCDGTNPA